MLQAVYGCYAAVQLADAAALHQLAAKLPFFFKHRSWQKGAFQVSVTTQCHTIIPLLLHNATNARKVFSVRRGLLLVMYCWKHIALQGELGCGRVTGTACFQGLVNLVNVNNPLSKTSTYTVTSLFTGTGRQSIALPLSQACARNTLPA